MADNSSIEWTDASWNPVTGCTEVSPGCDHCLDPETLVLQSDFTWRRLGDVKRGDIVVGIDEYVQNASERGMRMLRPSTVTNVWHTRQPAMRVTTDRTEVICSGEHRFLAHGAAHWIHARNFTLGTKIRWIGCLPGSRDSDNYCAGYLMGITDGDGTWRFTPGQRSDKKGYPQCYWRVAMTDEEALLAIQQCLAHFGLKAEIKPFVMNNGHGYRKTMQRIELRAIPHLTVLDEVLHYQEDSDYGRGYLAGMFDAEGSFHGANIRIANKNRLYLEHIVRYGSMLDLDFRIEPMRPNEILNARLYGPRRDRLAFFTLTQPAIRRKAQALFDASLDTEPETVVKLEALGERELIDIETSTHTFYANGLATHNCYARVFAERFRGVPGHHFEHGFDLRLWPDRLTLPLRWKRPRRIFVNSVADLFHQDIPTEFILAVFDTMRRADQHTYQVLTKRPSRVVLLVPQLLEVLGGTWPQHIWMGVSVENQDYTWRVDKLRQIPASTRFISAEPLLGPLTLNLNGIAWVITGAESGRGARPMIEDWVRSLRDQAISAKVAFFYKQNALQGRKIPLPMLDGVVWNEFPDELHPGHKRARML